MAITHPHVLGFHGAVTTDSVTLEERAGKFIYFFLRSSRWAGSGNLHLPCVFCSSTLYWVSGPCHAGRRKRERAEEEPGGEELTFHCLLSGNTSVIFSSLLRSLWLLHLLFILPCVTFCSFYSTQPGFACSYGPE